MQRSCRKNIFLLLPYAGHHQSDAGICAPGDVFNSKIRILSQKKLRDKLKIYLQTLEIAPDGTVCASYSRRELSEYLYADRSALSRELCKMRDEGILNFSGSMLQILDPDFLAI